MWMMQRMIGDERGEADPKSLALELIRRVRSDHGLDEEAPDQSGGLSAEAFDVRSLLAKAYRDMPDNICRRDFARRIVTDLMPKIVRSAEPHQMTTQILEDLYKLAEDKDALAESLKAAVTAYPDLAHHFYKAVLFADGLNKHRDWQASLSGRTPETLLKPF